MLLYLYIGSTVYVWIDTIHHQIYLNKRLKKEGYKFTGKNYFSFADVVLGTFYLVALSVPVFNLLFPLSHINKNRSYDEYMNYLEEAGSIEKDNDYVDVSDREEKKVITINDTKLIDRINQNGHTYYSPMYRGEEDTLEEDKGKVYKKY